MRILHIGKFFPPHPGGIERTSADLAAALTTRGVEVSVLAHAEPGTWRGRRFRAGATDVTLAACPAQLLYAPLSVGFPWLLGRAIREFRPDLLHLHVPNTSAFWALLSPSARRLPWVVHWHADIPHDSPRWRAAYPLYRPWEQALLKRARAVIATSQPYLAASVALAPWRDKARVIPLGIAPADNVDNSTIPQWPGTGLRVLAVGRLSHYKGFDVLLRALAQVPEASLVLVGDGECREELRGLAQTCGTRVRLAGHVDDATLAQLYAQADAFCLPSLDRSEAFGLVLLEAMRAGVPCVASDIPGSGVGYVVRNDETGLLVSPNDENALAAALRQLAADVELRKRLGAAGQQRWREEFTLDRAAERTLELYREILNLKVRSG